MKKLVLTTLLLIIGLSSSSLFSQTPIEATALGLPGDNLNLYAVLDVFQDSKTLEEFERAINSKDSNINNLDLNNDNLVDYISVFSYDQGHFHSIVLRVAVSSTEFQDVAVIEVSKNNSGRVIVQVIGDEALYGEDYIVEPSYSSVETPNPGYVGDQTVIARENNYSNTVVYVDSWPIIAYIFSPPFSVYLSPWHWGYYPRYYFPWSPILYYNYWDIHYHYYRSPYFRRVAYVRYPANYSYYQKRRTSSRIVERNRTSGTYRNTYDGRVFKRPDAPIRRLSRQEITRENSATSRQVRPSTIERNRESTRRQVQPSNRSRNQQSTREQSSESTRRKVQPSTRRQVQPSTETKKREPTRQQRIPSTRRQVTPSPSAAIKTNRQIRQSARETRRSNNSKSKKEEQ
ncbi:hypothetical protein QO200_14190 [Flavobacterium sp. Arc3]|uniref:hypothetical protein n=1 Tax=Flavobacterium sp. Arc3 TaxID=3046686 RepID=UPI00352FC4D4